jgi:hypothetical protein
MNLWLKREIILRPQRRPTDLEYQSRSLLRQVTPFCYPGGIFAAAAAATGKSKRDIFQPRSIRNAIYPNRVSSTFWPQHFHLMSSEEAPESIFTSSLRENFECL